MAWRTKDYDRFDPGEYCGDCDEPYCTEDPFAAYDTDGDLMEFVVTPPSGNMPEHKWYKKAGTVDTVATKPYKYKEGPCCYSLTIDGVVDNTVDESWCKSCDEINSIHYENSNLFQYTGGQYWGDLTTYDFYYRKYFSLCSAKDIEEREYPDGLTDQKYFTAPCDMKGVKFDIYLDDNTPPNIVAKAGLFSKNSFYYEYGHINDYKQEERPVACWKKNIAVYDGDYATGGYGYSYPSGILSGDFGTYDGRQFSVEFTSNDLYTPSGGNLPLLDGLCDFSSATLTINPLDSTYTNCGYEKREARHQTGGNIIASGYPVNDYCGGNLYNINVSYVPNHAILTIDGITGIDDSVTDSELTNNSCQNCTNLNTSFDLIQNSSTGKWDAGYYNVTYDPKNLGVDTCCDCPSLTTCIDNITVYFDYVDGGTYYDVQAHADINHSQSGVIASFTKHLGNIDNDGTLASYNNLANSLYFDGLSLDLDFSNQVYSSGLAPYNWQRCDFSNSTMNIQFDSFDNFGTTCLQREYTHGICAGKDRVENIQVSFPENGWSFWEYAYIYLRGDCEVPSLFSGDYILNGCNTTWYYSQAAIPDYDLPEEPPWRLRWCYYFCQPAAIIRLYIHYTGNEGDIYWPGNNAGYPWEYDKIRVSLVAEIIVPGHDDYGNWDSHCNQSLVWHAYLDSRAGSGIPIINNGEIPNIWGGPYIDCEVDLDGLELTFLENRTQGSLGTPFYIWDGSSITLSTV